jgi:hypothetical protein
MRWSVRALMKTLLAAAAFFAHCTAKLVDSLIKGMTQVITRSFNRKLYVATIDVQAQMMAKILGGKNSPNALHRLAKSSHMFFNSRRKQIAKSVRSWEIDKNDINLHEILRGYITNRDKRAHAINLHTNTMLGPKIKNEKSNSALPPPFLFTFPTGVLPF